MSAQGRWSLQELVEEYILRNNILQQAFSSISTPEVPVVGVTPQNLRSMHKVADSRWYMMLQGKMKPTLWMTAANPAVHSGASVAGSPVGHGTNTETSGL